MRLILYFYVFCLHSFLFGFQKVDLNQASKEQLMALPGVGEKLANAILEYKKTHKRFYALEDLAQVEGIKPKILETLKSHAVVGAFLGSQKKPEPTQKQNVPLDPPIEAVQAQVVKAFMAEPERMISWMQRARVSPWLPKVRTHAGMGMDEDRSLRRRLGDSDLLQEKGGQDINFGVHLEWKLDELVFNPNELDVAKEALRLHQAKAQMLQDATKLYYERQRLLANPLTDSLRADELAAQLHGLTGGWFLGQIQKATP